LSTGASNRL
jgi:hypothetical protein